MAPRGCFLDVTKSSNWNLFSAAPVVMKAPWTSLESLGIILDHFWDFQKCSINLSFRTSFSSPFVNCRALVGMYGARIIILWNFNVFLVIRILQIGLGILRLLERSIWSWFGILLRWNLDFPLRAPLSRWWRRVLRTIYHEKSPSQHPEDNLYEYCALAQEICGFWDDFIGSYGFEEVFLGSCQIFRLRPF